jgi:hypothetical protein
MTQFLKSEFFGGGPLPQPFGGTFDRHGGKLRYEAI